MRAREWRKAIEDRIVTNLKKADEAMRQGKEAFDQARVVAETFNAVAEDLKSLLAEADAEGEED